MILNAGCQALPVPKHLELAILMPLHFTIRDLLRLTLVGRWLWDVW
jgi:hypothetical protein